MRCSFSVAGGGIFSLPVDLAGANMPSIFQCARQHRAGNPALRTGTQQDFAAGRRRTSRQLVGDASDRTSCWTISVFRGRLSLALNIALSGTLRQPFGPMGRTKILMIWNEKKLRQILAQAHRDCAARDLRKRFFAQLDSFFFQNRRLTSWTQVLLNFRGQKPCRP